MERLNRKPDLSTVKEFELDKDTTITVVKQRARDMVKAVDAKNISQVEIAVRNTVSRILVNGKQICYDDLLDCFSDTELERIMKEVFEDEDAKKND